MRSVRAAFYAVVILLAGCGGGGGGSGGATGGGGTGGGSGGGTTGSLTLSASSLTFSATNLLVPPANQSVSATVTGVTSGTLYIKVVVTGPAVANVSNVTVTGTTTGQASVIPQLPQTLGPGTHTSVITVTACTTSLECTSGLIGTPQTINVTYTVNVAQAQPGTLAYVITPGSPDADFAKTLQIAANPNWTLTSPLGALTISPAAGSAPSGSVTVTLSRTAADALPTGLTNTQLVLANGTGTQATIPVSIDIRRPEVVYASPHAEPSGGLGTTTILRGTGLDVAGGFIGASFVAAGGASTPGSNLQVAHAREMRVQRPPLNAGAYTLQVTTSGGKEAAKPTARIVVVDPLNAPAVIVPYPVDARTPRVSDLIYDAERSALVAVLRYASDETDTRILRYTFANGAWSAPSVRSQPYLWSLALLPDASGWMGAALVNSQTENTFVTCNADLTSCANKATVPFTSTRRTAIGMTNDGEPLVLTASLPPGGPGGMQRYSLQRDVVSDVATPPAIYTGLLTASEDGSAVLIASAAPLNGAAVPMQIFRTAGNAGTGIFTAITDDAPLAVDRLAIDGRGVKAVVNGTLVYDTLVMAHIGNLPSTTRAAVLNRDGSRAYTWDQNNTVRTFNLSSLPATKTSVFTEILPAITPAGSPGSGTPSDTHLALTPDGRTLFMAGTTQIVVVPLP